MDRIFKRAQTTNQSRTKHCLSTMMIAITLVFTSISFAGKDSSGGGDLLPARRIKLSEFRGFVAQSKIDLIPVVLGQMNRASINLIVSPHERLLYLGEPNLFSLIKSKDIEILYKTGCFDKNKREVKASIYASKPNAICLSAKLIVKEITYEEASVKIPALIVHEFSHLLGVESEADANNIQKQYEGNLQTQPAQRNYVSSHAFWERLLPFGYSISKITESLKNGLESMSDSDFERSIDKLTDRLFEFSIYSDGIGVALFTPAEYDLIELNILKLVSINYYFAKQRQINKDERFKCFLEAEEKNRIILRYRDCKVGNRFGDELIPVPQNRKEAQILLGQLFSFLDTLTNRARGRSGDGNEIFLMPTGKPNPFDKFNGRSYRQKSLTCQEFPNGSTFYRELKFERNNYGETVLQIRGLTTNKIVLAESYGVAGLFGDDTSATSFKEFGNRWGEQSNSHVEYKNLTYRFERTPTGLIYSQKWLYRSFQSEERPGEFDETYRDLEGSCTLEFEEIK